MKKHLLASLLAVLLLCAGCVETPAEGHGNPASARSGADSLTARRQEDLDALVRALRTGQPQFDKVMDGAALSAQMDYIRERLPDMDEDAFYYELKRLAALEGDSHTSVERDTEKQVLPLTIKEFGKRWFIVGVASNMDRGLLGQEILAVGGHPLDEILALASPYISSENELILHIRFTEMLHDMGFLHYLGVLPRIEECDLTLRGENGETSSLTVASCPGRRKPEQLSLYQSPPQTGLIEGRIYSFQELTREILYIQYNACRIQEGYPMSAFCSDLALQLERGRYKKVIVDLRYNSGGLAKILEPVVELLAQKRMELGFRLYTLIDGATGSSAVTNAAQLEAEAGAVLVGRPTGGNVHFHTGVREIRLPNSRWKVVLTTEFRQIPPNYTAHPLFPAVYVNYTLNDYRSGIDPDIKAVMNDNA